MVAYHAYSTDIITQLHTLSFFALKKNIVFIHNKPCNIFKVDMGYNNVGKLMPTI